MSIRTFILLTLAISAFGRLVKNYHGVIIQDKINHEISGGHAIDDCENTRGDIVLIIDGSLSIRSDPFKKQIEFLEGFVGNFTIGRDHMRFGAVTFGDKIIYDNTFRLTKYTTKEKLKQGISRIDYREDDGKSTETHLAIEYARETLFKDARPGIKKLAIVITDGQSTDARNTEIEAKKMREAGIVILAIGVGKGASKKELETITDRKDYVFMVDKYSMLKTIKAELRKKTCIPKDEGCNGMVDIHFAFDYSRMSYDEKRTVTTFIKSSITDEYIAKRSVRFGLVTGDCQAIRSFYLNTYQRRSQIISHLDVFHKTSIVTLLERTENIAFTGKYGYRKGARQVAVIFLNGKLSDPQGAKRKVQDLRNRGIEVFVVKMDNMNSDRTLLNIFEPRKYILDTKSSTSMVQLTSEFFNRLCKR